MSVYAVKEFKVADVPDELENDRGLNQTLRMLIESFMQNYHMVTKDYRPPDLRRQNPTHPSARVAKHGTELMPDMSDMFEPDEDDRNRAKLASLGKALTYDLRKSKITLPFGYDPKPGDEGYPYAEEMRIAVPLYANVGSESLEVAKINLVSEFDEKKKDRPSVGCYSWRSLFDNGKNRTVEVDPLTLEKALAQYKKLPATA